MKVEEIPLTDVVPDPANVRLHDARNLEAIKGSLARFGQQKPIVVDRAGVIRAGNGTFEAARQLGWKTIHIVRTDLEGLEGTAYAIADNRSSDLSAFDETGLAQLLRDLQAEDALLGVGFEDQEITELLAGLESEIDPASLQDGEVPEPPENATTRRGDVWILGRHRLLCGDSASEDDLDRLLGGAPVHLLNTDPPYNVKVEPRSNNAIAAGLSSFGPTHHQKLDLARHPGKSKPTGKMRPKDRPLQNDFVSEEEFDRMLRAWFGNAARVLLPGRSFYVWGGYSNFGNYPPALRESGLYFSQAIIWDKQHPVLTRKDFMGAFEVAYYGWLEGAAHRFFGPPNVTDLWAVKKVNPQSMIHLTEKPVELAARAIQYSSRKGENVLDLFGGSGSTLVACEQTGRTAFLMEIDAPYADVIVERWQGLTGARAVLEEIHPEIPKEITMTPRVKKTDETKKSYTRRTPEQQIADLEAEIERVKARKAAREVRQSEDGKALLAAVKGLDKASKVAVEAGNKTMVQALERARAPLSELLIQMGVRVPAKGRQRELMAV